MTRRPSLSGSIVVNGVNVVVVVGAALLAVPLLIDRLGIAAYGVWTLAQTVVIYVTTAELGFGPALARFVSVHVEHPHRPRQVLIAALGLYAAFGLAIAALCQLLAAPLVDLFSVPARLHADAVATVGIVGWVTLAALLASALGHVLTGLERFRGFALTNALGAIAWLLALLVLLHRHARLQDVAYAALLQWALVALLRLASVQRLALGRGPRLPGRALLRDLVRFSMRLQLGVLSTLVNTQTDRVVIGAVAPAATLGQAGIATQVADAGRSLSFAAFHPMAARMAVTFGTEGRDALDALLRRQRRLWAIATWGGIAVMAGAIRPAIGAWLPHVAGTGSYDKAALFAVLLTLGYGVGTLPGPTFAYLRARGNPMLESTFGAVTMVVNLTATIAFGVLFGAIGVVGATTVAYVTSTAWVTRRARRVLPAPVGAPFPLLRVGVGSMLAAAATYGIGEALLAALPRLLALVGVGLAAGAVLALYLVALTEVRPLALARTGWTHVRQAVR
ncbi:MAG TPA: oligosaccharide flippase family protein [Conexibacter sp.]|nr:oligosaccharide flippase family protein [Conexibacter sp.]